MLVLTRKCQEKIQIGENITITVVRVKGQTVRIGIDAPREMKVLRTELPPDPPAEGSANEAADADEEPSTCAASTAGRSSRRCDPAEEDRRGSCCGASQPLAKYIPGTRMLAVGCAT